MTALISLHNRIFDALEGLAPFLIPTLARLVFAGTLLIYYWNSGLTKLGDGFFGFLNVGFGAYGQILPRMFEAAGYDASQLGLFAKLLVLGATWGEFILPLLLLIGLATRLAALGMIGFVFAQSWVDIFGHGISAADRGSWFDAASGSLIMDQRAFWVFLLIVIVLRGAGPLSLDAILRGRSKGAPV
ncbi:DoxX family membrane protein [Roseobacter sp. HKCCD9010]|uniref:DoxX family membrane protein n=1 Tax=unclassified Roseobacter TaxID=196798 RepID=UPI0014931A83|nr:MULTISPECIES: DoxX family membrane protein [unclassified Roseobacter]MBF9051298.1 DoxX family membrane protein [Rhodobacterales bacterium HKCCD4356]NNV13345.1 DoxX family membrane protein [Roseobacter sp. HKCCD7357]NNV17596.1 DoxX family membrane protein [Roseobacter sp. HKCCD8768]NNV27202.1 DoxX family membrane protein [Roseobacter sp. HKCCD8192]NNV31322.1 DoxX family membrane protein [Roseobacter sp. HKCCD9061]